MFVITADQRGSTRRGNRVDHVLDLLTPWLAARNDDVALPPERTAGDEFQLLLTSAEAAVDLALELMRHEEWSVGVGAGAVDLPLQPSVRANGGPAFVHARAAVERARSKSEPVPVVAEGDVDKAAERATAMLQLLGEVVRRRTVAGWEVADLLRSGLSQHDAAAALGITDQAVSQRVRSAMLDQERKARPIAVSLLEAAAVPASEEDE